VRSRISIGTIGLFLAGFAGDALAWGLSTHVFYAQYLVLAIPLADVDFRRAVQRLPRLVLAGACLPDLALTGPALSSTAFRRSHKWDLLRRLTGGCTSDEERAIAAGYASHLVSDIIAHNHFVPEHESRIANVPYFTHAVCEWALDHHLGPSLFAAAGDLVTSERAVLTSFVAHRFRCAERVAGRALGLLAGGERWLRASPVPRFSQTLVRAFDRRATRRFEAYVRETSLRLSHVNAVLEGREPDWQAEPDASLLPPNPLEIWKRGRLVLPASLI